MIHAIAAAVRRSAEQQFYRSRTLRNRCMVVSYSLQWLLDRAGVSSAVMQGYFIKREHCWVVTSKLLIDLTATQFNRSLPPVLILPLTEVNRVHVPFCPLDGRSIKGHLRGLDTVYGKPVDQHATAIIMRALRLLDGEDIRWRNDDPEASEGGAKGRIDA